MAEREKVVLGLERCIIDVYDQPCNCPYDGDGGCIGGLMRDALTLLREQDSVKPLLQTGGNYVCGRCDMYTVGFLHPITGKSVKTWKYCPACGRKVRWG